MTNGRELAILSLTLSLVVVLSILLLQEPPPSTLKASVAMRSDTITALRNSVNRTPFHRRRAERILNQLIKSGINAQNSSQPKRAEAYFLSAAKLAPEDVTVQRLLGMVYFQLKAYGKASIIFSRCLNLYKGGQLVDYTNLSISLLRNQQPGEAQKVLLAGLSVLDKKEQGPLHFLLSCIYKEQNLPKLANEERRKAESELGADEINQLSRLLYKEKKMLSPAISAGSRPAPPPVSESARP